MKKLFGLFHKVFLSSLGSIIAANASASDESITDKMVFTFLEDDNSCDLITDIKHDLSPKLLLKISATGDEWSVDAHRSHRSHQSHRSHYSSSSGHASHFSHYSSSTGGTQQNSGTTKPTTSTTTKKSYKLGDRTLYKDMKGADVTEALNLLVKKKYLYFTDGSTQAFGESAFDETMESAVKSFQKDHGLKDDGIIGTTTVYYLKKEK